MNKKIKVAVGMSGGVDSSVTAALLKEKGYEVIGLFMNIFDGSLVVKPAGRHTCYGYDKKDDIASVENICAHLGVPLHIIDMKSEFREHVIGYFRDEYIAGRTPNPCVVCNRKIKFGALLEKAEGMGIDFDFFATGHYARVIEKEGRLILMRSVDLSKDQTYFLYGLNRIQLKRIMFPLGEYTKKEARNIAGSVGLRAMHLPESQDFVSGSDYSQLFASEEIIPGDIVDENGKVLGRHKGIIHYTVGQRKGLGVVDSRPLYVMRIDRDNNRIVVGYKEALFSKELVASAVNLIALDAIEGPCRAKVKIRIQHEAADAWLHAVDDNNVKVIFDEPQPAITPGQSAVFYQGDILLGGGVIS